LKLRQFAELLSQTIAARVGLYEDREENQLQLLQRPADCGAIAGEVSDLFHAIRKPRNQAMHRYAGEHSTAIQTLRFARRLGIWYRRSYGGDRQFKPLPFVPPQPPSQPEQTLQAQLTRLQQELESLRQDLTNAQAIAQEEAKLRAIAEQLLQETEADVQAIKAKLNNIQASSTPQQTQQAIAQAQSIGRNLELNEDETRILIDEQLQQAGWEVDSQVLKYQSGTRPEKGRSLAIAEYPVQGGYADYVLFTGLKPVAIVEAKRQSKDVPAQLEQAKRYSRNFDQQQQAWGEYQVPFVFSTNGREYLEQLRTASGIWFCDVRRPQNISRPLKTWYSPHELLELLKQDLETSHQQLEQEKFNYDARLRQYQIRAIQAVETHCGTNENRNNYRSHDLISNP